MNDSDLLTELEEAFSRLPKPKRFTPLDTEEAQGIERDFLGIPPGKMTYGQTANLIVDLALISDEGVFYFLPRLARAALLEGGNAFMLLLRLQRLDLGALDRPSRALIEKLLLRLEQLENELDQVEEKDLREGWASWREQLLASGALDDRLLVAITDGDVAEAERLLSEGANIRARDYNGNTAISLAEMSGNAHLLPMIKKWGG